MHDKAREILEEYKQFCSDLFFDLIENGPDKDWCGDEQSWADAFSEVVSECRRESYKVDDLLEALSGEEHGP